VIFDPYLTLSQNVDYNETQIGTLMYSFDKIYDVIEIDFFK